MVSRFGNSCCYIQRPPKFVGTSTGIFYNLRWCTEYYMQVIWKSHAFDLRKIRRYRKCLIYATRLLVVNFEKDKSNVQTIIHCICVSMMNNRHIFCTTLSYLGCISLRWSGSGSVIQDHLDHGASKDPMNSWPEWILRFLWWTMIRVILDHWSWSSLSQRNPPLVTILIS